MAMYTISQGPICICKAVSLDEAQAEIRNMDKGDVYTVWRED
jgi:hypothetical protein